MEERGRVVLSSNWNTLEDVSLKNILVKNTVDNSDIEVEDLNADNCVCLVQNKNADKSKAELEIKTNGYMKDVVLFSEGQVIEVFGVNDEYLLTCNAKFFDDWEEMAVYYSKISLPNIPVCKLKFTRTKYEKRLWIYGVKVLTQNTNHDLRSPIQFNFEQICRLSGNANAGNPNNFKNIIWLFLQNLPNNNVAYALGKKVQSNEYNNHITDNVCGDNKKEKCVEEILSKLNVNESESCESKKINLKEETEEYVGHNIFLAYIDRKCHEIKKDILHEVDMKFNSLREETNYKLDKIISLLENERIKVHI